MSDRTLAYVGIGLYVLRVVTSASDAVTGAPQMLEAALWVLAASLIYVIWATVRLLKLGAPWAATALAILSFAAAAVPTFSTEAKSNLNIAVNAILFAAMAANFYAIYLLFILNPHRAGPTNDKSGASKSIVK